MQDWADPNTWDLSLLERRIYGDDNAQVYAIVDEEDYWHFTKYKWTTKRSRGGPEGKFYLRRAVGENANGMRLKTFTLYLHVEIMKRKDPVRPCVAHTLVDHRDGQSLNCRRSNLRWATPTMNNRNRFGIAALQEEMV